MKDIILKGKAVYYGRDEASVPMVARKVAGTIVSAARARSIGRRIKGEVVGELQLSDERLDFTSKAMKTDIGIALKDVIKIERRKNIRSGKIGKMLMVYWREDGEMNSGIFYPFKGLMKGDGERWYENLWELIHENGVYDEEFSFKKDKSSDEMEEERIEDQKEEDDWEGREEVDLEGVDYDDDEEERNNEGKKFCISCGGELPSEARFCSHCGAQQ